MAFLVAAALSVKFGASPLVDMPSSHDAGCHHKMALAASAETEPPAGMLTYILSLTSLLKTRELPGVALVIFSKEYTFIGNCNKFICGRRSHENLLFGQFDIF